MVVKKIALVGLVAMAFSASALADDAGFYIGGQLGVGWQHVNSASVSDGVNILTAKPRSKSGLAGRVSVGYDFNKCYGAEVGYAKFKDVDLRLTGGPIAAPVDVGKGEVQSQMIDVLVKGVMPIQEGFNIFGKVGAAYVTTKVRARDTLGLGLIDSDTTHRFRPEAVAGVGYSFDDHTTLDVSYSYVWGTGSLRSSHYIPNLSLAAVGVTYKF